MNAEFAHFEVTEHYVLPERGGFVIGRIRSGDFRLGMSVYSGDEPPRLTISGIEFLDNTTESKFWNALMFREHPDLEFLKRVFPVGTILLADHEGSS
jgi:hypothetical protein